jgi:DNA modification methylase
MRRNRCTNILLRQHRTMKRNTIIVGDCLETMQGLPDRCVSMCVTSPPYYGLRDYGCEGQHGLEPTPAEFVAKMVKVFGELRRILADDGTLWLNLGDSYARNGGEQGGGNRELLHMEGKQKRMGRIPAGSGLKPKDLLGIPWRVALALQADGWWLRQDIIWHKTNPMPEFVTDRCSKSHEYLFLLTKGERYHFDHEAIKEPGASPELSPEAYRAHLEAAQKQWYTRVTGTVANGKSGNKVGGFTPPGGRNRRSVWSVPIAPYAGAHFATYPPELIKPCILAGCPAGGIVFDPYGGSGTTGQVARALGRDYLLCELNPEYAAMAERRIKKPLYDDSPKTPKPCAGQRDLFASPEPAA